MNDRLRLVHAILEAIKIGRDWFGKGFSQEIGLTPYLRDLVERGLAIETREGFMLNKGARLILSQLAISLGAPPSAALRHIKASEFEDFAHLALRLKGFIAMKRMRITSKEKRAEFDIIGIKGKRILIIDCKKWKRYKSIGSICSEHYRRVKAFSPVIISKLGLRDCIVFPLLVTLYAPMKRSIKGCILVPIDEFESALDKIQYGELDSIVRPLHL